LIGVESIYLDTEFVQDTFVASGINYQFRVRAKNKHGWGPFSDSVTILAAVRPEAPLDTKSEQLLLTSRLSWDLPVEHGAAVIEY